LRRLDAAWLRRRDAILTEAADKLKERTLILYNERPRWLADAHEALDRAVAATYGWPEAISTEDALARLLGLNLERASAQRSIYNPAVLRTRSFFPCLIQVSGEIGYFVCLIPVAENKSLADRRSLRILSPMEIQMVQTAERRERETVRANPTGRNRAERFFLFESTVTH
jgi:hypothetical protein